MIYTIVETHQRVWISLFANRDTKMTLCILCLNMFRKIPQSWGYFATHARIFITRSIICTYVDIDYLPYKNTTQYYPFQKWWNGSDLYLPQISIRVHMYMIASHPWKCDYILNHLNKYPVNSYFSSKNQLKVPGHFYQSIQQSNAKNAIISNYYQLY